jgi:hypothetical protein
MSRLSTMLLVALGIVVAASCGGTAFSTSGGTDGGGEGGSDAPAADASSGGGETSMGEGGEADARADASSVPDVLGEASPVPDAHADAVEEGPPATCTGTFACVPTVPGGWSGPFELYAGASPAPSCTADFTSAYDGNAGLSAPPGNCSCSCVVPNTECTTPTLAFYSQTASLCLTSACSTTALAPGVCKTVSDATGCGTPQTSAISASAPVVELASCTPQASKSITPTSWATTAQACSSTTAVVQDDCQAGSVCAPKPSAPYGATLCISQLGDVSCPPGSGGAGYSSKQVFYGGVDDLRTCTACTCGSLGGATCSASFEAYSSTDGSCTGGGDTYAAPFSCEAVDQPADFRLTIIAQNGSCGASQVTATGSATPTNPTTFCCLP